MAPCNGCYHNLKKTEYELATSEEHLKTVQDLAKKADDPVYKGDVRSVHLLEWLMEELGPEGIKDKMSKSLKGVKVANYYGCMYTRPRQIFPERIRVLARSRAISPISWTICWRQPARRT